MEMGVFLLRVESSEYRLEFHKRARPVLITYNKREKNLREKFILSVTQSSLWFTVYHLISSILVEYAYLLLNFVSGSHNRHCIFWIEDLVNIQQKSCRYQVKSNIEEESEDDCDEDDDELEILTKEVALLARRITAMGGHTISASPYRFAAGTHSSPPPLL
ncbi:hypothetical protein L1987_47532 [Smallanthus sonchifolius]|uniref:Uncharacterized protein n=1 Tax=Smallanthus sonchifolius TaxID=185202 RepID=A0ACB9G3T1_9ASTR|nr:hypothetical protein L1987_47532 [Smallanthus sonchifolius]